MPDYAALLGASKAASTLLVLFIPSCDRNWRSSSRWRRRKMAKNIERLADLLGAAVAGTVPETGGGAFGAARLAALVASLQARLEPGQGRRPGRPTDARWVHHPKIPMSEATAEKLARLAELASTPDRRVSPMQVAAQLLEDAVARCTTQSAEEA